MKNSIVIGFAITIFIFGYVQVVAHGDGADEEAARGQALMAALQEGEKTCADLSGDDFDVVGEHFMDRMMGDAHEAMNVMMEQMMGIAGEEQMHVVMGKRLSGCDVAAALPVGGSGFMPMMQMMTGMGYPLRAYAGYPLSGWGAWAWTVLSWLFIIVGLVTVVRWVMKRPHSG